MCGGDPVPGPLNPEGLNELGTEAALRVMIKSMRELEASIRAQRQGHEEELRAIKHRKLEELDAKARLQESDGMDGLRNYLEKGPAGRHEA